MPRDINDYEIKSKVRGLLVRYWIDTTTVSIGVHRGVVSIIGNVKESSGAFTTKIEKRIKDDPFMEKEDTDDSSDSKNSSDLGSKKNQQAQSADPFAQKLFLLECDIEDIPGVRAASLDFSNYKKNGGVWKKRK